MIEPILRQIADRANLLIWERPETFPWMVALLLTTGIFVTFRMKWVNVRHMGHAINIIRGKYDTPEDSGDISHFQALATVLSATVGIGNIAGVALGIHYGGPGVLVWLWISGIFGMTLKYAECTLAVHYRKFDKRGNAAGGPMYYIEQGLGSGWRWMAVTFAVSAVISSFGIGNMNQSNTVAVSAAVKLNLPCETTGIILAGLVALVILGGIKRIAAVSSRLMPAMALLYVGGALYILSSRIGQLPQVLTTILQEALTPKAAFGGTLTGVWHLTMLWGVKRALFSNEAGMGSAPIAYAAAKTKEPVREGLVAMIGPFVDTLVICTMTGLVILVTGVWDQKKQDTTPLDLNKLAIYHLAHSTQTARLSVQETLKTDKAEGLFYIVDGEHPNLHFVINDDFIENPVLRRDGRLFSGAAILDGNRVMTADSAALALTVSGRMLQNGSALTSWAFETGFGKNAWIGSWIVALCVFLFALSTMISWSYYGDRCVQYLFGVKYVIVYRIVYVVFVYIGSVLALETVWAYGDMALGLMTFPNLIAVLLLSPKVTELSKLYFKHLKSDAEKARTHPLH